MKKLVILIAATATVAVAAFLLWQKSSKTTELVAKATPEIPEQKIQHPELLARIKAASEQSLSGPEPIEGLAELSRLYHANGFTEEAWQCYATLVVVEPDQARWPYRFGRILAGYGQLEEATPLFEKASKLAPDYTPAHFRLGDTLLKQNRLEAAESAYNEMRSIDSDSPYAALGLARVAIGRENWEEARELLESAAEASNFQIGADLLGDVYEQLGLPSKENLVIRSANWGSYADIPDPWSLTLMDDSYDAYQVSIAGGWAAHQGDKRTGLRYVKRAVELDPENTTYHYQLAGLYSALGNSEKAEEHFRRCVEIRPDFADAWLGLITIARDKQSPTLARRTLEAALNAAPDSPSLNIEKGKILVSQRQFQKAYPFFEKSIEVRPHEAVGYIALAEAYLKEGRIEEGLAQMEIALVREPANAIALSSMAFDAIMRSDKPAADKWLKQIYEQPRIRPEDTAPLESMYQKAFGSAPRR